MEEGEDSWKIYCIEQWRMSGYGWLLRKRTLREKAEAQGLRRTKWSAEDVKERQVGHVGPRAQVAGLALGRKDPAVT